MVGHTRNGTGMSRRVRVIGDYSQSKVDDDDDDYVPITDRRRANTNCAAAPRGTTRNLAASSSLVPVAETSRELAAVTRATIDAEARAVMLVPASVLVKAQPDVAMFTDEFELNSLPFADAERLAAVLCSTSAIGSARVHDLTAPASVTVGVASGKFSPGNAIQTMGVALASQFNKFTPRMVVVSMSTSTPNAPVVDVFVSVNGKLLSYPSTEAPSTLRLGSANAFGTGQSTTVVADMLAKSTVREDNNDSWFWAVGPFITNVNPDVLYWNALRWLVWVAKDDRVVASTLPEERRRMCIDVISESIVTRHCETFSAALSVSSSVQTTIRDFFVRLENRAAVPTPDNIVIAAYIKTFSNDAAAPPQVEIVDNPITLSAFAAGTRMSVGDLLSELQDGSGLAFIETGQLEEVLTAGYGRAMSDSTPPGTFPAVAVVDEASGAVAALVIWAPAVFLPGGAFISAQLLAFVMHDLAKVIRRGAAMASESSASAAASSFANTALSVLLVPRSRLPECTRVTAQVMVHMVPGEDGSMPGAANPTVLNTNMPTGVDFSVFSMAVRARELFNRGDVRAIADLRPESGLPGACARVSAI